MLQSTVDASLFPYLGRQLLKQPLKSSTSILTVGWHHVTEIVYGIACSILKFLKTLYDHITKIDYGIGCSSH